MSIDDPTTALVTSLPVSSMATSLSEALGEDDPDMPEDGDTIMVIKPDGTRIVKKQKNGSTRSEGSRSSQWMIYIGLLGLAGIVVYIWLMWKNKNTADAAVPDGDPNNKEKQVDDDVADEHVTTADQARYQEIAGGRKSTGKNEERARGVLQRMFGVVFVSKWFDNVRNPKTGRKLQGDCVNESLRLVVEVHGRHHFEIDNLSRTQEELQYRMDLDDFKEGRFQELGYAFIILPYTVKEEDMHQYIYERLPDRLKALATAPV